MAENCTNGSTPIGRTLKVLFSIGCGEDDPKTKTYSALGKINSKQLNQSVETASDSSDENGEFSSEVVLRINAEITVSGFITADDGVNAAQGALRAYRLNEVAAGRQPTVWLKVYGEPGTGWGDIEYYFMNVKDINRGADDLGTIEFTFALAATGSSTNKPYQIVAQP